MEIKEIQVGMLRANCYLVYDEKTREALIIDPGAEGEKICRVIKELGLKVKYIVNTHGHYDHVNANDDVREETGALLYIHEADSAMLHEEGQAAADGYLEDGDLLEVGNLRWVVRHTPGHSKGGICLAGEGVCFSGDTLFAGTIGRTDLDGGSMPEMLHSLKTKLLDIPDEYVIYPGHGSQTTMGRERKSNPYILKVLD